ncbi:MAG: hypothetical protein IJ757_06315 [Clostridiales bacterium]|nr:hypothetical protein [Clostridiales bacterium]
MSVVLIFAGFILIFDGATKVYAYYSDPIGVNEIPVKRSAAYAHILLEEYEVVDVIHDDSGDTCWILVKAGNRYVFIECSEDSGGYRELSALTGRGTGIHDYVINGYFLKSKSQCVDFLRGELIKHNKSNYDTNIAAQYTVLLFPEDSQVSKIKVWAGVIIIIVCIICDLLLFRILKRNDNPLPIDNNANKPGRRAKITRLT